MSSISAAKNASSLSAAEKLPLEKQLKAPAQDGQRFSPSENEKNGSSAPVREEFLNASGHVQELDRYFGLWSLCAVGVVADNAWGAGSGALVVAMYNGGAPGVLWGFVFACIFYGFIGASLAELSSAIPSSANVYHWASVTGGKWGRLLSYYAGYWNWLAWNFGCCFSALSISTTAIAIYNLYHPDYVYSRWHAFIGYVITTWLDVAIVLFGQRILPLIGNLSGFMVMGGWLVTLLVIAIYPAMNGTSASNEFVWVNFVNSTGYSSAGFVFLAGTLNGAFAIGTPDGVCHLAEEIPDPRRNVPKGIFVQLTTGFVTTFAVYIAFMYGITSLDDIFAGQITALPLAGVYLQATKSIPATTGLLVVFLLDLFFALPSAYIAAGRMLWTMGRDNATPFSGWIGRISPTWRNQFNATLFCGIFSTVFGAIYIGSSQAFSAFVDCFTILTTLSYLTAILPHLLARRRLVKPGPFWMPDSVAYIVIGLACMYIIVFNGVIYFFPFSLPVSPENMNYSIVIVGGLTILLGPLYWYKVRFEGYVGPQVRMDASDNLTRDAVDSRLLKGHHRAD